MSNEVVVQAETVVSNPIAQPAQAEAVETVATATAKRAQARKARNSATATAPVKGTDTVRGITASAAHMAVDAEAKRIFPFNVNGAVSVNTQRDNRVWVKFNSDKFTVATASAYVKAHVKGCSIVRAEMQSLHKTEVVAIAYYTANTTIPSDAKRA